VSDDDMDPEVIRDISGLDVAVEVPMTDDRAADLLDAIFAVGDED
jgi:hypothetical protein